MIELPKDYHWSEIDKTTKIHITHLVTGNKMNISLCGQLHTKINDSIMPENLNEKYFCKKCLYVLWTIQKKWREQFAK